MAGNQWEMKLSGIDELIKRMEKLPNRSEQVINNELKVTAGPLAIRNIDKITPVSKGSLRKSRKHAKGSNEYQVTYTNLGFVIRPKKKFNYLKYPDLGIGTSSANAPQAFLKSGLDKSVNKIRDNLLVALDQTLNGGN